MKLSTHLRATVWLALTLAISGCATVVNGRTQEVTFSSDPLGAMVFVDGVNVGTTPVAATLRRDGSHAVRIEKPGYVAYEMTTVTIESRWDAANGALYYGALLGMIADHNLGGMYEIRPTDVSAQLLPGVSNPIATTTPAPTSPPHFTLDSDGNLSPIKSQQ